MMKALWLCGVCVLLGTSLAVAQTTICTTKENAIIGISPSVIDQAVTLRADKDWDALEELRKRGLLVFAAAGQELRAEHYDLTIDTVRKPGSPDRWYALRSGLDCTQPPKTK